MNKCGSCIHSDFNPSWIKWCEAIKDYIHIASASKPCQFYQSAWEKNLFGETRYRELLNAGLVVDADWYSNGKDLRPCMVMHRNPSKAKQRELLMSLGLKTYQKHE